MRGVDAPLRGVYVIRDSEQINGMGVRVINDAARPVVAVARLPDGTDADKNTVVWRQVDKAA